jgi:hypothetical protein
MFAGPVLVGLCGIVLLALGYLVGVKHRLHLLAGYRAERVPDQPGLSRFAGAALALMGVWTLAAAIALAALPQAEPLVLPIFIVGILAGAAILGFGSLRFARSRVAGHR